MTIRHLRVFAEVCSCGSVTQAAQNLFISQPAASAAIAELESHYGIRLFDRIGRRLYVTEAGKRFLGYVEHILRLFDEMEHVRDWEEGGVVRVGTSITVGNRLLPGLIRAFQGRRPQTEVEAVVDNSEAVEERVLRGEIDLGLIEGSVHSPLLESIPFFHDRMVLILPPDAPWENGAALPVRILGEYPLLLREKGSAGREILDGILSLHGITPKSAWQSISTQAIIRAAHNGLGISLLPYLLVQEALERGEIRYANLEGVSLERGYFIIRHNEKFVTPAAQDFIALCLSLEA